jgi:predicted aspartyl protease
MGMIRYNYARQFDPPAPFIYVSLICPETGDREDLMPAQIDTGADRTIIPGKSVKKLGLTPLDEFPIAGLGGLIYRAPTYKLELAVHTLPSERVEVIAHDDEPYVLLGRDVLNRFRILLDGPGLALEIG